MAKSNSDMKSIRKKLLAAIAMVLVASVMVVSSSYAWFTLSTAPEVKGITTSVGANGNLEMALLENSTKLPETGTNISNAFPGANYYWGNLVDLSSNEHYHLDQIALRPARLNAVKVVGTDTTVNGIYTPPEYRFDTGGFLKTPVYGTDGRLSSLSASNVINGKFDDNAGAFVNDDTDVVRGVRPVGTTSSLSPAELKLRNAKQAVNAAIADSESNATLSLRDDSVKLANIIVMYYLKGDGTTYGSADVATLKAAIANLQTIADDLHNALKQAVVAIGVAQDQTFGVDDVTFSDSDITLAVGAVDWTDLDTEKADLLKAYGVYENMQTELTNAKGKADALTDNNISFPQISEPLTHLLSTTDFKIVDSKNGVSYDVDAFKALPVVDMAKIMLATPTISIVDGIYFDIAQFIGNFSATTSMMVNGTYEEITLNENVTVVMATNAAEPNARGYYLKGIVNMMSGLTASGDGAAALLTDIYGYAVDLAFRTNASGSSLLLQTEAANRVDDDTLTQGGGSYMEFKSGHADFSLQQVAELMRSVRVVFMDDNRKILAVAVLDTELVSVYTDAQNSTRKIADANSVFTVTEKVDNAEVTYELELANAELTQNNTAIKAPLVLYNFSLSTDPNTEGKLVLTTQKTDGVITSLVQNTAKRVSALVYLDGDTVENSDVAIAGNSMTGSMNLQFASSATLDPMDYTFTAEQLPKPSISITDNTLTITADDKATSFDLYVGDKVVATDLDSKTYDLSNLSAIEGIGAGPYQISVVAKATGYTASEKSNVIEYTVATT